MIIFFTQQNIFCQLKIIKKISIFSVDANMKLEDFIRKFTKTVSQESIDVFLFDKIAMGRLDDITRNEVGFALLRNWFRKKVGYNYC